MDSAIHSAGRIGGMTATSPSPRQLTRKGQATRQRIVDAAADLIFRQGVALDAMLELVARLNGAS